MSRGSGGSLLRRSVVEIIEAQTHGAESAGLLWRK